MRWSWRYVQLGDFTYNILPEGEIKPFLMEWLVREWEIDHREAPDQPWIVEWLDALPEMAFSLEILGLEDVRPRPDLMNHKTPAYDFMEELLERAAEREESLLRGVSTEPIIVNRDGFELMDGYTRYMIFHKYDQKQVYAYVGVR